MTIIAVVIAEASISSATMMFSAWVAAAIAAAARTSSRTAAAAAFNRSRVMAGRPLGKGYARGRKGGRASIGRADF
jgi:hypothetical protein